MEWCAKYIGIPFADHGATFAGCDCWGLVRMVYADVLGVQLVDFAGEYESSTDESAPRLIDKVRSGWLEVDHPLPLDVILLKIQGRPWHVGIVAAKNKMLHVTRAVDAVIDDYTRPMWARRIEGFYRWVTSTRI